MTTDQRPRPYDVVEAIQWHEGMLLAPHHFQQLSIRQEQMLHYIMSSISPFYWGVSHLDFDKMIDKIRLADGEFCLQELEAILPDGLMIAYHVKRGDKEIKVDLKKYTEILQRQSLFVYVKVVRHSTEFLPGEQRYQSIEGVPVKGMNDGEGEEVIPRWRPIISLSVVSHQPLLVDGQPSCEKPPTHRFASFPLAEITYRNQTWELTKFVPPHLSVSPLSAIGRVVTGIIQQARSKANFLVRQLHSSTSIQLNQSQSFSTQNVLQGLAASLPPLEAMLGTAVSHPYPLYLGLCTLAGSVATFTQARVSPVFKSYNHNDLWSNFQEVGDFILNEVLNNIQEFYMAIPFDYQNKTLNIQAIPNWLVGQPYFLLRLEPEYLLTDSRDQKRYVVIGLTSPDRKVNPEQLGRWGESCLIAALSKINAVRDTRIYGATRQLVQGDEQLHLSSPKEVKLLRVEVTSEFIEVGGVLVIVNELKDLPKLERMVLYTKPPKESPS